MAHLSTNTPPPRVEATLNPDRNEIRVRKGDQSLTLTFPEVRQVVAEIAEIYDQVQRDHAVFAEIYRGPKGVGR